ncbi:sugar phosphate isomerase/epimerase [Alkalihalobacillus sp. MEB130]|uniref:sugar phosphate isomerase/epimerase family protein n=1 Tax=Alkalihalobacillus sp. MEB130 TaxID=2976704 RepID=UPI0028DDD33A|nr:sugar phosphate isomerase/epimerase [Alkalihalobacillus sp. MEB130]MDT8860203.1 sugar phosphate isomerase/epimerase [Alkalihalobacillus sp. MEB130]
MNLGIIAKPTEESFQCARDKGLHFLEFCINDGHDVEGFYNDRYQLKKWVEQYDIQVGSIGRWKSLRIDQKGQIIESELEKCFKLIDAASDLKCSNFVCGVNYVPELSYYENCTAAIGFLSRLVEYAKSKNVTVSTYNCRKGNFVNTPETWKVVHGHVTELGIKYDPSHCRYDGGDYLKETMEWGDRFQHVHLKGSLLVDGKRVDDPPAGLDQTDWKTFLSLLRVKGYHQGLSIEPHSPIWTGELGEKGVDYTISYMKNLLV